MNSVILTITVLLGLLFVPAVEMKSKRCHKRPTVVECPDQLNRTCGNDWRMIVTIKDKYVGDTGKLNCLAGFSLIGNPIITCLESGVWSPINATCVPDDLEAYVRDFRGSTYTFVKTYKNFDNAKFLCSSMCGTLVEINNKEENQFIVSAIEELFGFLRTYIGLQRSRDSINYEWQSGNMTASNGFDDWYVNNPDIATGRSSCVLINLQRKWDDVDNNYCFFQAKPFVCESRFN
ncbi:asialoglycoprotein receptor 2-like [Mytilus edulis]|uniref:asialoglycoprotein receptor 2-like n=1 Tax=Mytilus edulis TaxID=6550 RepID=UPI0039F08564